MFERLESDIKAARLSGDKEKTQALMFIKSALATAAKDQGLDLSDEAVTTGLLRKEAKKRQEAAELFDKGGNNTSAEKERYELALIQAYLPQQLADEEIRAKLLSIVDRDNLPRETASMGRLIGVAKQELGTNADPSVIARIAAEIVKGN